MWPCGIRCASIWSRGAPQFHTGVSVTAVTTDPRLRVHCDSGADLECDGVVLATDVAGLQRIVDGSPGLGDDDWRARVAALGTAPPFVVQRLWLDRPVQADRSAFLGTGGRPAAGQCQRARTLRTGGGGVGPTAPEVPSSNCTPMP